MGRTSGRGALLASTPGVARRFRVLAAAVALALVPVVGLAPTTATAASAVRADYPSWSDVAAARQNQAAAVTLKNQLESSLQSYQDEAQRTQDDADAKGEVYATAQQAYDEQQIVTQALVDQTTAAQAEADEAYSVAAQVIAQMSKTGSIDIAPQLVAMPGSPDAFLSRLETSRVLGSRYATLYERAIGLRNTAKALAEQEKVAEQLLEELRQKAEEAFAAAQAAAQAAAEKLAQTQRDIAEVRARIDYLTGVSNQMVADYNAGIKAKYGDAAEGEISSSGWARPAAGYITSVFGMRVNPVSGIYQLHTGVDLAGYGCGGIIRAAHSGTVTYAGWSGTLGYYVQIDHGDGTSSGYGHMPAGAFAVGVGDHVDPGQPIGKVGTTGQSTGCHLHFIIRVNGNLTDPVPFMRNQGIVFN
jgi:murein DD-endopeptidase MepM/ murein hydrolase activator NlpD